MCDLEMETDELKLQYKCQFIDLKPCWKKNQVYFQLLKNVGKVVEPAALETMAAEKCEIADDPKIVTLRSGKWKKRLLDASSNESLRTCDDNVHGDGPGTSVSDSNSDATQISRVHYNRGTSGSINIWKLPALAWPKEESNLLAEFCLDSDFRQYQRELLAFAFRAYCAAKCVNEEDAQKLSERMETEETTILLARVGELFVAQLVAKLRSDNILPDEVNTTTTTTHSEEHKEDLHISTEVLEHAFDQMNRGPTATTWIYQVGRILYDHLFTQEEKLYCTFSGRNGTRPFDQKKVRLLSRAVAWLLYLKEKDLKTPRTFDSLQEDIAQHDRRLNQSEESILKIKVLTEYAYMRRKQLERHTSKNVMRNSAKINK